MTIHLALGMAAGVVASFLFAAATNLSILSVVLFITAPLPLFAVGLGWGSVAAAVGAVSGGIVIGLLFGPLSGLEFLVNFGAPAVILTRLAWLSRASADAAGRNGSVEWYPLGRLVLWAAALSSVLAVVTILREGPGAEAYFAAMRARLDAQIAAQPELADTLRQASPDQYDALIAFFIRMTPMVMAALWTTILTANVWLGARLLTAMDRSPRTWAPFPRIEFPRQSAIVLGIALVATLLPGTLGVFAESVASALVCAFAILGIAVIHYLSKGFAGRTLVLATTYMALIMFNWLAALGFAALGVAETGFGLRARKDAGGGPST